MFYPYTEDYKDSKFFGQTYSLPMILHIVLWQTNFFSKTISFHTEGEVRLKKKMEKHETRDTLLLSLCWGH